MSMIIGKMRKFQALYPHNLRGVPPKRFKKTFQLQQGVLTTKIRENKQLKADNEENKIVTKSVILEVKDNNPTTMWKSNWLVTNQIIEARSEVSQT